MKTSSSRTWLTAFVVALVGCMFVTVTGWLLASPSEDINQAVAAGGHKDAKASDGGAFINAFTSVLVGVDAEESPAYTEAAKKLRPDLAEQISAAAEEVDNAPEDEDTDARHHHHHHVSQHRHQVQICCSMHTLTLPARKARYFLATHHTCHPGACYSHHHGHWHWHNPGA